LAKYRWKWEPIIAPLFAIQQDYLLTESISVVAETILNDKVEMKKLRPI
jgi:hypothetical protein